MYRPIPLFLTPQTSVIWNSGVIPASALRICEHTHGSGAGMSKSDPLRSATAPRIYERSLRDFVCKKKNVKNSEIWLITYFLLHFFLLKYQTWTYILFKILHLHYLTLYILFPWAAPKDVVIFLLSQQSTHHAGLAADFMSDVKQQTKPAVRNKSLGLWSTMSLRHL